MINSYIWLHLQFLGVLFTFLGDNAVSSADSGDSTGSTVKRKQTIRFALDSC